MRAGAHILRLGVSWRRLASALLFCRCALRCAFADVGGICVGFLVYDFMGRRVALFAWVGMCSIIVSIGSADDTAEPTGHSLSCAREHGYLGVVTGDL